MEQLKHALAEVAFADKERVFEVLQNEGVRKLKNVHITFKLSPSSSMHAFCNGPICKEAQE